MATMAPQPGDVAASGTPDEFGALVAAQIPDLYRYARWLVANSAEAEDVVGDTVVRAIERRGQFRGDSSLRAWLHRILYHLAIDRSRHLGHEISVRDVDDAWNDESFTLDAAEVVERAETRAELAEALVHLPVHYRTVVVLHDAHGWSAPEIASVLDIGVAATQQRLRRGRMMLVNVLARAPQRREANRGVPLGCVEARAGVSNYLDDELGRTQRLALETHLATCATCPPLFRSLVGVTASLGALNDPDSVIGPELVARIRARTADHDDPGSPTAPHGRQRATSRRDVD